MDIVQKQPTNWHMGLALGDCINLIWTTQTIWNSLFLYLKPIFEITDVVLLSEKT